MAAMVVLGALVCLAAEVTVSEWLFRLVVLSKGQQVVVALVRLSMEFGLSELVSSESE